MRLFLDFWGSAKGPVSRLSPMTRIVCGALLFASVLVFPLSESYGLLWLALTASVWTLGCGLSAKAAGRLLLWSVAIFLPLFLFIPWLPSENGAAPNPFGAIHIPLQISVRGIACLLISASTAAVLSLSEVQQGLARLPLPRVLVALVVQVLHQTAVLIDETTRIAYALRLRRVVSGRRLRFRLVGMFPAVWMLRIIHRAERVGTAMELRGYDASACLSDNRPLSREDILAISILLAFLAFVVYWRLEVQA